MSPTTPDPFSNDFTTTEIPRIPENLPKGSIPPPAFDSAALAPLPAPGYPPQRQQRSSATIIAIILAVILFFLIAGMIVYFIAGDAIKSAVGGKDAEQPSQVIQTVIVSPDANKDSGSGSATRPTRENFPISVVPVNTPAINNAPAGNFQKIFKSGPTSDTFAYSVAESFLSNYYATGNTSASLTVYSAVTGQNYYMTCTDRGSYVHCTGGNNANVYIS